MVQRRPVARLTQQPRRVQLLCQCPLPLADLRVLPLIHPQRHQLQVGNHVVQLRHHGARDDVIHGKLIALAAAATASFAPRIALLIDPAKLAKLGERGANPRVQKYVAQLAEAQQQPVPVNTVVAQAVALAGMKGEAAKLTADAMLRNLTIAERLGCLDKAGLRDMQRG